MSCYRCAEPFRFFRKEVGCANCGFAFCSKCCNWKSKIPSKNEKVLNVCEKCFNLLNNKSKSQTYSELKDELPKNFYNLVESNKSKDTVCKNNENQDIINRLEKLNEKPAYKQETLPTTEEIASRLAKLNENESNFNLKHERLSNLPSKDKIQSPDDLISKLQKEVEIDKDYEEYEKNEIEKLEQRLNNLMASSADILNKQTDESVERKSSLSSNKKSSSIDQIADQMLKDAELARKLQNQEFADDDDGWCCLCNDDADFRCIDCENDLYCHKCFKRAHNNAEYKHHRKVNATAK